MGSQRRHATILFADISGFTSAAERLDPEDLTDIVNECFAIMEAAVRTHGGHVDKYIGDCVMATFGVPVALENAPRQAINAAIYMRACIAEIEQKRHMPTPIRIHIGINTGLVVAGDVGGELKRDFTVMGDAVNVASRIKDAAKMGAIWVGSQTHAEARDDFEFRKLATLGAKGKDQPIDAWEVLSTAIRVHRTAFGSGRPGISSAMVGRERELEMLSAYMHHLLTGTGGMVSVLGEAGIGKSRLVAEMAALEVARGACILEGRSVAIGGNQPFHPFVDLLQRWAGIADKDDAELAVAKLETAIREVAPQLVEEILPFVATLMGLRLITTEADGGEGEGLEELTYQKVRLLFAHLAAARPTMIVFEDLHWADQSSIKLLETLLRLATRHPLLFVVVGRPDYAETFDRVVRLAREQFGEHYVELPLGRLDDPQCEALIRGLLGGDVLPYPTRAMIVEKTGGNPFFVEEVIRSLVDEGAVVLRAGRFALTEKINAVVVPGTIQEVIMARVDRLDLGMRQVLEVAAVIGRFFQHRVLAAIVGDGPELEERLHGLLERQLIDARQSRRTAQMRRVTFKAEREYVFKHALLQETTYESILQKTRREMHRQVAATIEEQFGARLADFYPMLAYHYSRADDPTKAEEYLFKAGEEAARSAASDEALAFFEEASRLYLSLHGEGGDPRKKARLEKNIALALLNKGSLTASIDHFDLALEHLGIKRPGSRSARYLVFVRDLIGVLIQIYVMPGRRRPVADGDPEHEIFQILLNRGRAEITSDPTRLFLDTVGVFRRLNRVDARTIDQASATYASVGSVFAYSGISFDVAQRALVRARELIRPGSVRDQFTCASMEFIFHYLRGDWSEKYDIEDARVEEAVRLGQLWDVNTYVGLYCDRELRQGNFAGARVQVDRLADLNDGYGYAFAGVNRDIMAAILFTEERRLEEARELAEGYQRARHEDPLKVLGLGTLAKVQALLGEETAAASSLAAAEAILARSREIPPWHMSAYAAARLRRDVLTLEAAPSDVGTMGRRVRRHIRHAMWVAARTAHQRTELHQLAGRCCWLLGRRSAALRQWRTAIVVGKALGARPELARTWGEIGRSLAGTGAGGERFDGVSVEECVDRAAVILKELGVGLDHGDGRRVGRATA